MKKGEKMTPEHKEKILAGLQRAAAEGKLGRKKGTHVSEESKIKISNALRVRNGKKPMTAEERAQNIAEHQAKKAAREKELQIERKAELAAQILAHEQTMNELQKDNPKLAEARAKWKIDADKVRTHNQYITTIAMLPLIDFNDPAQVQNRIQDYLAIAEAAGQRIVFETCALAFGMSRKQLMLRITGQIRMSTELAESYAKVRAILDSALAEYAHSGEANALTTFFFARNNQGYTNEDPKNIVENASSNAEQTNEEIRRKYGDLPL